MKSKTLFLFVFFMSISMLRLNAQNPWIQPIVQSVSGDSLFATIGKLQRMDRVNSSNSTIPPEYLRQRLLNYGMDTVFFQYYRANTPPNVVGIRYGEVTPNEYWVMGAHYDAVVPNAGADDNGSGTAAVVEMARVIRDYELERSLMLVLFSAEEVGLWGSKAFIDSALNYFNIAGMINLDMIAYSHLGTDSSVSVGWKHFCSDMMDTFSMAAQAYVPELTVEPDSLSGILNASDHASFWAKSVPALFLIENLDRWGGEFNPYYHQPSDTIGKGANSPWLAEKITRSAIATLLVLTSPFSTISVEEHPSLSGQMTFHPNPAFTQIQVSSGTDPLRAIRFRLYDRAGKMLMDREDVIPGSRIDISGIPTGLYFVSLEQGQQSIRRKLVKL